VDDYGNGEKTRENGRNEPGWSEESPVAAFAQSGLGVLFVSLSRGFTPGCGI